MSQLNPLKICLPSIVNFFAALTRKYQIAFCDTIIERNRRQVLPVIRSSCGGDAVETATNPLDSFFPFDPYVLNRSKNIINPLYEFWEEQSTEALEDTTDVITEEQARRLRSQPARLVGPKGLLYVQQREFAATTPRDGSVSILGSDDATTCHIVVIRHTGSGATCLTHCDGSDTEMEVLLMMNAIKMLSSNTECGRLEVHLVGGFNDDRHLSQQLTNQLLKPDITISFFCLSNPSLHSRLFFPAVNVKTGEVFHATFPDRGPAEDLRSASILTGAKMVNIYDSRKEELRIGPYFWMPFPHVDFWLQQDDEHILQNLSTSPLAEPPHFVSHIRATLVYLKEHPFPDKTLFPNRRPWIYRKNSDGLWERVSADQI
uniref:Uncharacterized protein n=1 Tax=Anolis carolinensis TaxID=28377 RepID=H9G882_ANOCA